MTLMAFAGERFIRFYSSADSAPVTHYVSSFLIAAAFDRNRW